MDIILCSSLLWVIMLHKLVEGLPVPNIDLGDHPRGINNDQHIANYLLKFGYIRVNTNMDSYRESGSMWRDAILDFQSMANIPQTGELDNATIVMMSQPRCGLPDIEVDQSRPTDGRTRRKRFAVSHQRWTKTNLTYRITYYTTDLTPEQVDTQIAWAFQHWAEVTPLTFQEKRTGPVDIEIRFVYGDHGDGSPFDYSGGLLAHAYYPPINPTQDYPLAGDAHFDDAEQWTIDSSEGANLLYTAIHEFGHSLGLMHSYKPEAIMWPWVREYQQDIRLEYDDILAIQTLYGGVPWRPEESTERPSTTEIPSTTTTGLATSPTSTTSTQETSTLYTSTGSTDRSTWGPAQHPVECDGQLDAITLAQDGNTYAFKGSLVYILDDDGVSPGFPRPIDHIFSGSPGDIDAALTYSPPERAQVPPIGGTYIFKDQYTWLYKPGDGGRFILQAGYPKTIPEVWGLHTDKVTAAFSWSGSGAIYFLNNDQIWKHSGYRGLYIGYPRMQTSHSILRRLPRIDAALRWKANRIYMFSGNQYYRWTSLRRRGFVTGPRSTSRYWFGCDHES